MNRYGIEVSVKNKPELDLDFIPLQKFNESFLKTATVPFAFALERNDGQIHVTKTFIHGDSTHNEADKYYVERLVKFALLQVGGFKLYVKGNEDVYEHLKSTYSPTGLRSHDSKFMESLFQSKFEIVKCDELPEAFEIRKDIGRNFGGCRIGIDIGGSDYKVSAMVDGEVIYSNETVWNPKINSDPDYHYNGIVTALKDAASRMPRVDAIGVSTAGIVSNNQVLMAQLYQKVPKDLFDKKVRNIWLRAVKEIGEDIPFEVLNDGDVTALAGSMTLEKNNLVGIAMGTSVAGGYVDKDGYVTNWLNELAFVPVDASPNGPIDDWSGDMGVGVHYFCQEAVIKLSGAAGISLDEYDTPAKKLKAVQILLDDGHDNAAAIFRSIGCYLGHTAALYNAMYNGADNVLLLGRVMSGKGGDIIIETANKVLESEYPALKINLLLPDEHFRRLGQSAVAASLPETNA